MGTEKLRKTVNRPAVHALGFRRRVLYLESRFYMFNRASDETDRRPGHDASYPMSEWRERLEIRFTPGEGEGRADALVGKYVLEEQPSIERQGT